MAKGQDLANEALIPNERNIYSLIQIILSDNLVNEIIHKENTYINDKIRDDDDNYKGSSPLWALSVKGYTLSCN